jgi:hypothetical protein
LFYNDYVASLSFPVRSEGLVELGVKFPRGIVRDVEQLDRFRARRRDEKKYEQRDRKTEELFHLGKNEARKPRIF